jgi:hypothetical protein
LLILCNALLNVIQLIVIVALMCRMDPNEPFNNGESFGDFLAALMMDNQAVQFNQGSAAFNASAMHPPPSVHVGGSSSAVPPKQVRKKVYALQKKLPNFSPREDVLLVKSYIEVSCDPVVGTSQNKEKLWTRIMNLYNQNSGNYPERSLRSAQSRWDLIKLHVGKFCGYLSVVHRGNHSGMNDADKVRYW